MIGVIFVLEEDSLVAVLVVVMDVELVVGVVDAGLMEKSDEGTLVSGASSFGFVGSSFVVVCSSSFVSIVCSCFCSTTSFDGAGDAKEFEDEVVVVVAFVVCSLFWTCTISSCGTGSAGLAAAAGGVVLEEPPPPLD